MPQWGGRQHQRGTVQNDTDPEIILRYPVQDELLSVASAPVRPLERTENVSHHAAKKTYSAPYIRTYGSSSEDSEKESEDEDDMFHDSLNENPDVRPKTRAFVKQAENERKQRHSTPKYGFGKNDSKAGGDAQKSQGRRTRQKSRQYDPETSSDWEREDQFPEYMENAGRRSNRSPIRTRAEQIGYQYEESGDERKGAKSQKGRKEKSKMPERRPSRGRPAEREDSNLELRKTQRSKRVDNCKTHRSDREPNDWSDDNEDYHPKRAGNQYKPDRPRRGRASRNKKPKGYRDEPRQDRSSRRSIAENADESDTCSSDHDDSDDDYRRPRRSRPSTSSRSPRSSQGYRNRLKQRDPKPFDGSKIEWSDYLKHFEAVANWNEWTTKQKAKQLVMSFDGEALKLLGEFSEEVLADYGKVVAELNRRYDPAERAQAWKIEFRNRIRRANESIMQFAQALRRLALKAFPNMSASAQEQWVMDQFSLGLSSVEIRRHVQFGHPVDLNAAISLAIEFEAFESGNKDKLKKPVNKGEICALNGGNPHDPDSRQGEYKKSADTPEERRNHSESGGPHKNIECFYCKKKGHMLKDCLKLKNKREREENSKKEESPSKKETQDQGN